MSGTAKSLLSRHLEAALDAGIEGYFFIIKGSIYKGP
jgi:hypothetical protein